MKLKLWQRVLTKGMEEASLKFNSQQVKVFSHLAQCRTKEGGDEIYCCGHCGYELKVLRSCRDRHCPCCQFRATQKWCQARAADVLPVTYFHLVFTLPSDLNGWVSCHASVIYRLLFHAVAETLKQFGRDPKRLDGQLGFMAILHTWGQTLVRHVHLHCLVPGGALAKNGEWHAAKGNYLFPVKALSRHFRGRMVTALRGASKKALLARIPGDVLDATLERLMQKDWVVYSKAATYGHDRLVNYLGRYTRKIALTTNRLLNFDGERVSLRYRDYHDGQQKTMMLSASELIRRFALHVLPCGFMRIRFYGYLANAIRKKKLVEIRKRLSVKEKADDVEIEPAGSKECACPQCGQHKWHFVGNTVRWHWQPG